jgi:putative transposase/transposase-like zinc-binding protein
VIEVADVFRRFADEYCSAHGSAMPPSHRRAITDILACRTEALGGHVWQCDQCSHQVFSYHSCKNRACPKCHTHQTEDWLAARQGEMLPVPYFHVTVTVPEELRPLLRANQRDGYALLMKAAAEAIVELARDPRFVGGTVGVLAVLHTWTQQLVIHPHVHCLVTGGGISADGRDWYPPARKGFLFPTSALAKLVRGKLKAFLIRERPDLVLPTGAWTKRWVIHITPWGQGEQAVLDYLARYVFRIAITNTRIVALDDRTVTFRYKDRHSSRWRTCRLEGCEFMRRFLQHVLPKGFHKVRYFGLWHPANRRRAAQARLLLEMERSVSPSQPSSSAPNSTCIDRGAQNVSQSMICPICSRGRLVYVGRLTPKNALGP